MRRGKGSNASELQISTEKPNEGRLKYRKGSSEGAKKVDTERMLRDFIWAYKDLVEDF